MSRGHKFMARIAFRSMWITPETLEAPPGFEPGNKGFAGLCLTAWLRRLKKEGLHVLSDGLTPLPKRETGLEPATPTLATLPEGAPIRRKPPTYTILFHGLAAKKARIRRLPLASRMHSGCSEKPFGTLSAARGGVNSPPTPGPASRALLPSHGPVLRSRILSCPHPGVASAV